MPSTSILLDVDSQSGVAVLTLNRPERYNAFDRAMAGAWADALESVRKDRSLRALVITGAGKAFCAGGDVDEIESFLEMDALERRDFLWRQVHRIALTVEQIEIPVIAAINGTARGAGLDMALMCDLRVIDEEAVVAMSYIHMGVMPGDGGSYFLPRLIGLPRALEYLWTGDPIDARTAMEIGLVNRVAPPGQALARAIELAARLAAQPIEAIRFTKRAVYDTVRGSASLRSHLDAVASHMSVLEDLPAFRERVQAFKARRPPSEPS